jgi:hypothetical protein
MLEFNLSNTELDLYNRVSPVTCWKLNIISFVFVLLFTSSFFINSILLWIFLKEKQLRTPLNSFVITFTVLSLVGSIIQGPIVIASNFFCRYFLKISNFLRYRLRFLSTDQIVAFRSVRSRTLRCGMVIRTIP